MLFFGKWAVLIPMPSLAAILIFVSYNMSEWRTFVKTFRSPRSDIAVLLVTFTLTVLIDLTVAIEVGVVLAAFLFMRRMANVTQAGFVPRNLLYDEESEDFDAISGCEAPKDVEIFEVYGSLFFGAVDQFKDALRQLKRAPKVLILRMRNVLVIDATGLHALEDLLEKTKKEGTSLVLSGVHAQPLEVIESSGLLAKIGEDNICDGIDTALEQASKILGLPLLDRTLPLVSPSQRRAYKFK